MTRTILNKRQFKDLYELSLELLREHKDSLRPNASMEELSQVQWMHNGMMELITKAYTDIKEDE